MRIEEFQRKLQDDLNQFLSSEEVISFSTVSPEVSIVIVAFNKAELTLECLRHLHKNIQINSEVIVVDNGSTDQTAKMLSKVVGIKIVRSEDNLYFGRGCALGVAHTNAEFILFLNNDVLVKENFDLELMKVFESHKDVGLVGGKLLFFDQSLQEAGCMISREGIPTGYGRYDDPRLYQYNYVREVDYCSAAMVLLRKDVFLSLGGFDKIFEPAYFEDVDLMMKIRSHHLRVMYTPFSEAIHLEHGSMPTFNVMKLIQGNFHLFKNKWNDVLEENHSASSQKVELRRQRARGPRILVVDNRVPVPSHGGGYPRAWNIYESLLDLSAQITLFPLKKDEVDTSLWSESARLIQFKGIEVVQGPVSIAEFLRQRSGCYDLVIVSRMSAMRRVFVLLKSLLPEAKIIFDSEALDFERQILKIKYETGVELSELEVKKLKNEELSIHEICDYSLFISEREKSVMCNDSHSLIHKSDVLSHWVEPSKSVIGFKERKDLLFVGGFLGNSGLNEHSLEYLIQRVLPLVRQSANIKLRVVGSNMPQKILALREPGVEVVGYVEDLVKELDRARYLVIANQFAGGIPLKVIEAFSRGLPAVVSPLIANQLQLEDGRGLLVGNNEVEFANKIVAGYDNEELWSGLSLEALAYVRKHYSKAKWDRVFISCLGYFQNGTSEVLQ